MTPTAVRSATASATDHDLAHRNRRSVRLMLPIDLGVLNKRSGRPRSGAVRLPSPELPNLRQGELIREVYTSATLGTILRELA